MKYLSLMRNGYMYNNANLIKIVKKYAGETQVKDIEKDFCIPSYEIDPKTQKTETRIFSKKDSELFLADIILASSSAPFYFEPYMIAEQQKLYIDGGIF